MVKKNNKLKVNLDDENDNINEINTDHLKNNDENNNKKIEIESDDEEVEVKKESKGKMVQRHKMELKKLQQDLDKQNHAIPKKDKKAKSEFTEKAKKLEDELIKKQKEELCLIENVEKEHQLKEMNDALLNKEVKEPSKSHLKKSKRIKDEEQRMKDLEEEKKNYVSKSKVELDEFISKLTPLGKQVHQILPDGDCMYQAITNQLLLSKRISELETKTHALKLRKIAADYILSNQDEFSPFIIADDEYSSIQEYCDEQILTQGKWGGHLELKALSNSLQSAIVVYNARQNEIIVGEEFQLKNPQNTIYLSYHRHAFTLGEHYNSVIPILNNLNIV